MDSVKTISRLLEENKKEVTLRFKDEVVVSHHDGDYTIQALKDSNFVNNLAFVVAHPEIRKHNSIMERMRDYGFLDDYERGSLQFESYVAKVIEDNWLDYISEKLVKINNKRGVCHLKATVEMPSVSLIKAFKDHKLSLDDRWQALIDMQEDSDDE